MEDEIILEEAKRIRKQIATLNKKYPDKMFYAFCVALMSATKQEYDEFVDGIDELTENDKIQILTGMLENKIKSYWSDLEGVVNFGEMILMEFNKIKKGRKRK